MAPKKTNIKIKRKKFNLYNRKKSKLRQTLTVVLTVLAACVLGVVGYGIGKPIMNYLQNKEQYTSDPDSSGYAAFSALLEDNSEVSSDISSAEESSSENTGSSQTDANNAEPQVTDGSVYFLAENAAANSASLNSALAAAKDAGYSIAAVTLKTADGTFLYKSEIAGIKDSDSISGTLTASQICDIITKSGLTPAAKINTLADKKSGNRVGGNYEIAGGGGNWLDNSPAKGGKMWLSPFKNETVKFAENITRELAAGGFKHIICAGTTFPAFHSVDVTTYLNNLPLSDNSKRAEALWNVLNSAKSGAEKNGAQFWIEISGDNILKDNKLSTDAEIASDGAKLKTSRLIIDYTNVGSAADAYKNAKTFAGKAKTAANGAELYVMIRNNLSGSALEDVKKAFSEENIKIVFSD